ncbi:MAG: hypothetical protein AAGB07_15145, partial [Pseudomonadota bacterium]
QATHGSRTQAPASAGMTVTAEYARLNMHRRTLQRILAKRSPR